MFPDLSSIKKKRVLSGITQKQLAKVCNISQSMIAKIESKKIEPSYSIAKKIFNTLENLNQKEDTRTCENIMSKRIIFIDKNQKVKDVSKIMHKYDISQVPVISNKEIVGVIGENIILSKLAEGKDYKELWEIKISDIMSSPLPTVNKDFSTKTIIPIIKESGAILIMQKEKPVGIITKSDLI